MFDDCLSGIFSLQAKDENMLWLKNYSKEFVQEQDEKINDLQEISKKIQ